MMMSEQHANQSSRVLLICKYAARQICYWTLANFSDQVYNCSN
jgi:hypothetical protein